MTEVKVVMKPEPYTSDRRRHRRIQINVSGTLLDLTSVSAMRAETVRVTDISESGVRFETAAPTRLGPHFRLHVQLPNRVETLPELVVVSRQRTQDGFVVRCEFEDLSLTGRRLVDRAREELQGE